MTKHGEPVGTADRLVQLEKFLSSKETERWCKILGPYYPAADYWLSHEARILQEFQRDQRYAARFIAVDLDRRLLVGEADGHPLTHWLSCPTGALDHPFQKSSNLIRLIKATCKMLQRFADVGLVHGGLRPDILILRLNAQQEIDFDSLKVIDFSVARSPLHRVEKPPFIDVDCADAAYLSPAAKEAINQDWARFAKLCGEPGKRSWYEISDTAKRQYDSVLLPDLAYNSLDWRCDLYALAHWFRQISLHRLDYFKDSHQEALPALLKRMQKPVWQGGFSSLDSCLRALDSFELDPAPSKVETQPQTVAVTTMHPLPVLHSIQLSPGTTKIDATQASSPKPRQPAGRREPAGSSGKWLGIFAGMAIAGIAAWSLLKPKPVASRPQPMVTPPVQPSAVDAPAPIPAITEVPASAADTSSSSKPEDFKSDSLEEIRAAAEAGNASAQTKLGLRYRNGQGLTQDNEEAVKWYRKAAEQNHPDAQAYLGFMYMSGRGVKRDDAAAFRWSLKGAEQGSTIGQYNLGLLYANGRGTRADLQQAYRWFKKAASGGENNASARQRLAELKPRLNNTQIAEAERLASQ